MPHLKAGGAERVVSFLFNQMNRSFFDPHLLVIGFENEAHYPVKDINVIYLNKKRLKSALFDIVKTIKTLNPEIVFSSIGHINIYLGFLKIFFFKTKFIAREASVYSKSMSYNKKKQLPFSLIKNCYHRLDALVYQSTDMKNDFEQTFKIDPSKGNLIHNPITLSPSILAKIPEAPTSPIKFLIVGSLIQSKGHQRVIDLFEKIKINFILEIVGDGPLRVQLEQKVAKSKIRNKVIFRGIQKNMQQIYSDADFLIQGSFVEGFPNVVLEALSYGIPSIVFNAPGGHKEMIVNRENGSILQENVDDIKIIEETVTYNWDRVAIQKDAFKRFGPEIIMKQYEAIFLHVINA